jgi:hypothetical protein
MFILTEGTPEISPQNQSPLQSCRSFLFHTMVMGTSFYHKELQHVQGYHNVPQGYHKEPQGYHKVPQRYHKESVSFLPQGYPRDTKRNYEISQGTQ